MYVKYFVLICGMKSHKSIRIDNEIIEALEYSADEQGRSFNNLVERLLAKEAEQINLNRHARAMDEAARM